MFPFATAEEVGCLRHRVSFNLEQQCEIKILSFRVRPRVKTSPSNRRAVGYFGDFFGQPRLSRSAFSARKNDFLRAPEPRNLVDHA